jgi:hypothetical protein
MSQATQTEMIKMKSGQYQGSSNSFGGGLNNNFGNNNRRGFGGF